MFGDLLASFGADAFPEFRRIENEIDRLFGRTAWPVGIRAAQLGSYPPINVGSTPERVTVYLFAAGLDPKSLGVSIQQNLLTVSGSRKIEPTENVEYYRQERFDGEFHRVFTLPDDVNPDRV